MPLVMALVTYLQLVKESFEVGMPIGRLHCSQ
jgi:hypothetical protein